MSFKKSTYDEDDLELRRRERKESNEEFEIRKKKRELKSRFDLSRMKNYSAELFWLEIRKLMEKSNLNEDEMFTYILCKGNSGMRYKRDVIDVISKSHLVGEKYAQFNVLSLSRNGLYQSVPEAMFHPLALGHVYSTVDDIVKEIKNNHVVTDYCMQFFSVFDTIMFEFKSELLERQVNWPYEQKDSSVIRLVQEFYGHGLEHTYTQALILLSTIVFNEDIKSSLKLQGQLLSLLLEKRVELKEIPFYLQDTFERLGSGVLGINSGLMGQSQAELDDLLIKIWLEGPEEVDEYIANKAKQNYIRGIMESFDITSRDIHIEFQINDGATKRKLGYDGYLGVNMAL